MIYRKIYEVEIGWLRQPELNLPKGINMGVIELKPDKAVAEFWCSDNKIWEHEGYARNDGDLLDLENIDGIIKPIASHSKSPKKLAEVSIDNAREVGNKVEFKGIQEKFKRKLNTVAHGKGYRRFIIEE